MQSDDNPFAEMDEMGPGSSPFGAADHVVCCKCGGSVPREDAAFKIKTGPSWYSVLLWGPLWGLFMSDDQQHRGYYCPLCLRLFQQEERRKRILAGLVMVVIIVLIILMEFIK